MVAELEESNLPTELWDGELLISPSPSFFHQEVVDRFHDTLKAFVRPRRLGATGCAPLDMVLTNTRAPQPDVVLISGARLDLSKTRLMGASDLVAEVISPNSRRRDRVDKRDLYEQHGVKEHWLIDGETQSVEGLHLGPRECQLLGRWRPGEQATSRLLKRFHVKVSDLFSQD